MPDLFKDPLWANANTKYVRRARLKREREAKRKREMEKYYEQEHPEKHFSEGVTNRKLSAKTWIRNPVIGGEGNRVWKQAIFINENYFFTRRNKGSAGGMTLYHICANLNKMVVYQLVNKKTWICNGCEEPMTPAVQLLVKVQKL